MDFHEVPDLFGAEFTYCILNKLLHLRLKLECLRDILRQLPKVIKLPRLHCLQLLLQDPFEEDEEFFLLGLAGEPAMDVDSIDGVSQTQILRPEVEQILLNTRIF